MEQTAERVAQRPAATAVVDYWFDPVCPYSWIGSRWLAEVARQRPLHLRHHLMSLYLLNEDRTDLDPAYLANVRASRGPARVFTAVAVHHGEGVLQDLYAAFGEIVFDRWRYPSPAEYQEATVHALTSTNLPVDLADAATSDDFDEALRESHHDGMTAVGREAGTPTIHLDGRAFFGPVLNAIPRGREAVAVFEGARLLSSFDGFFELKRTRTTPPVFT